VRRTPGKDACASIPSILAHDPFRPLDWRLRHARHRIVHRQSPRRDDDPATRLAVTFLRRRVRDGRRSTAQPRESWAAAETACALAARADLRRSEVEARILAGQDDPEIGRRCELAPEAVSLFEAPFFVRDRLGASDWIVSRALGPGIRTGFGDFGLASKAVGYFGGDAALEAMIAATDGVAVGTAGPVRGGTTPVDPVSEGARLLATALLLPVGTSPEALAGLRARFAPQRRTWRHHG
jgi:hypothetical protein